MLVDYLWVNLGVSWDKGNKAGMLPINEMTDLECGILFNCRDLRTIKALGEFRVSNTGNSMEISESLEHFGNSTVI